MKNNLTSTGCEGMSIIHKWLEVTKIKKTGSQQFHELSFLASSNLLSACG